MGKSGIRVEGLGRSWTYHGSFAEPSLHEVIRTCLSWFLMSVHRVPEEYWRVLIYIYIYIYRVSSFRDHKSRICSQRPILVGGRKYAVFSVPFIIRRVIFWAHTKPLQC